MNLKHNEGIGISSELLHNDNLLIFLQQFIDSIPLAVIVIDTSGSHKIVLANKNVAKSLGTTVDKMVGKNFLDFFHDPEIREKRKSFADKTIQTKKSIKLIDKRGNRYFDNIAYPIFDTKNNVIYAVAMAEEITELKDLEKKIADREQLFSSMIQNSEDFIYLLNEEGKIIYISPASNMKLGYSDKRLGQSIFDNIYPTELKRMNKLIEKIKSKPGSSKQFEVKIFDAKGNIHHLKGFINNQLENPHINAVIVNARDITSEKIRNEKIRNQKEHLDNIINNTHQIIFTINEEEVINLWNDAAEKNTGLSKSHAIGKKLKTLDLFENIDEIQDFISDSFKNKKSYLHELIVKNTGKKLWKVTTSIIYKEESVSNILFICEDITWKKGAHDKLIPGSSYIIDDPSSDVLYHIVKSITQTDGGALCITRNVSESSKQYTLGKNVSWLYFSENTSTISKEKTVSNLDALCERISSFIKNVPTPVITLNRLDYLIGKYGFEEVLTVLYTINDLIQSYNGLFFLRVNSNILTKENIGFLYEEFLQLPSQQIDNLTLTQELFDVLRYIQQENSNHKIVIQSHICKNLYLSKVTVQKRIDILLKKGLILTKKKGRANQLLITEKGKTVLHQRKTI